MASEVPRKWGWRHLIAVSFFLFHSTALLQAARPLRLVYPRSPADSGLTILATLEKKLYVELSNSSVLGGYIRLMGIEQQWYTFAPNPPRLYCHHVVTAETDGGVQVIWDDGLALDRAGVGLFYSPTVKLVENFRNPRFQEAFLAFQTRQLQRAGGLAPKSVSLEVALVLMEIDSQGHLRKSSPKSLVLRTMPVPRR